MKKIITLFLIVFLFTYPVQAKINLKISGELDYQEDTMRFGENTITEDDIKIISNAGTYFEKDKKLLLKGDIKLNSDDYIITSSHMEGLTEDNLYIFEENVIMKNINPDKEDFDLESQYLKLNSETKNFTAENSVKINHDKKQIESKKADYNNESELLNLSGAVKVIKEDGTEIRADQMDINLKSDSDDLKASGNIDIVITDN